MNNKLAALLLGLSLLLFAAGLQTDNSNHAARLSRSFNNYLAESRFCHNYDTCLIESRSRGSWSGKTLQLGDYSYSELPGITRFFEETQINQDLKAYTLQDDMPAEVTCVDASVMYIHKLASPQIVTDDGTFNEQGSYLDLYSCFVDADSRRDYLNSTRIFYILD